MKVTLMLLRSEITTLLFKGPKPDDSKLNSSFFNQIVLDARANAIEMDFVTKKEFDPEIFSEYPLTVQNLDNISGEKIYTVELPKIVYLKNDLGLRVKGLGNDPNELEYYELVKKTRITTLRKNIYRNKNRPICYRVGNKLTIYSMNAINEIVLECILFDPTILPNFDEKTTDFPVSGNTVNLIKKIVQDLDIKLLKNGTVDEANNSIPPFPVQKMQEQE